MRLFLFFLPVLALAGCRNQSQPPPLVLGHVAALSGADAAAGKQAERGLKLALEDLGAKASEKLNDRPLVVRHVDAAGELDVLEAAAIRLVKVNGAIGLLGGTSKEEAALLDRARVPVLSSAGARASGLSDLVFTTGLSTARQGEALSRHLAAQGAPVALIVDAGDVDSQAGGAAFKKTWTEVAKKDGSRLHEFALGADADFAKLSGRIDEVKPKTVVFAGEVSAWRDLQRQWKGTDTRWAYIGPEGALTGADATNALIATSFALDKETAKIEEFAKKYRAKFDEEPTVHAALAYDNVRLLVEALQQGQSLAPEKLRDELLKIKDFAGITGPLSFAGQHQLRRPAFIAELRGEGPPTALKMVAP
jgi:branched-chain amino acid transport system substrate-binding protein